MTRAELAVTIAGLIATFALPWPCGEAESVELRVATIAVHFAPQGTANRPRPHEDVRRVRAVPDAKSQPTR